jgi:hypothetical protein
VRLPGQGRRYSLGTLVTVQTGNIGDNMLTCRRMLVMRGDRLQRAAVFLIADDLTTAREALAREEVRDPWQS